MYQYIEIVINTKYLFAVSPHAEHDCAIDVKTMATNENPEVKVIYSDIIRHNVLH